MKFPVYMTEGHGGKVLEVNADQEVVTLYSDKGEMLGTLSWGSVIEQILADALQRAPRSVLVAESANGRKDLSRLSGEVGE